MLTNLLDELIFNNMLKEILKSKEAKYLIGIIVFALIVAVYAFTQYKPAEAHFAPVLGKDIELIDTIKIGDKTLNRADYKANKTRLKDKVAKQEKLTFTEIAEWKDTVINQLKECRPSYKGSGKIDIQILNGFLEQDC